MRNHNQSDGSVHVIELLVGNNRDKAAIIERAKAAPLHVSTELLGDGEGEATVGLDMGWNASAATVRIIASARIRCGSDPERHMRAMDHCMSLAQAFIAAEIPRMEKLVQAMGSMNLESDS